MLSQLHHEATVETCPGSPRWRPPASTRPPHRRCFRGLARGFRFFGHTKISQSTQVAGPRHNCPPPACSVEHTRAVSVGSLFSLSPYFARLVASHHHPRHSP